MTIKASEIVDAIDAMNEAMSYLLSVIESGTPGRDYVLELLRDSRNDLDNALTSVEIQIDKS